MICWYRIITFFVHLIPSSEILRIASKSVKRSANGVDAKVLGDDHINGCPCHSRCGTLKNPTLTAQWP